MPVPLDLVMRFSNTRALGTSTPNLPVFGANDKETSLPTSRIGHWFSPSGWLRDHHVVPSLDCRPSFAKDPASCSDWLQAPAEDLPCPLLEKPCKHRALEGPTGKTGSCRSTEGRGKPALAVHPCG